MNIKTKLYSLLLILFSAFYAVGQSNSNLNKEVEVIKNYQPSISEAYKIGKNPTIDDTTSYTPNFIYNIYSNDIKVEKNINHFPVVKLSSPPRESSNKGYAKAALGNALTPYGELIINNSPGRNTDFGVHFYHFSSRPKIKLNNELKVKAPYSKNMVRIFAKNYFRKSVLQWDIKYQRDRISYYGFPGDTTSYRSFEESSDILNSKQVFNNASTGFKINNTNTRARLDYGIGINYNYFWNSTGQTEHWANYNGLFTRRYRDYQIAVDTKFDFFRKTNIIHNFDSLSNTHNNYHAQISPEYYINKGIYELRAGFNLGTIINADSTLLWNISPKVYFAYHPIKGVMTVFAGSDGGFNTNNYSSMVVNNPYIDFNTDMKPSEEVIRLYGGFKGKVSRRLSYLIDVNYSINKNEALYFQTNTHYTTQYTIDSIVFNNMFTPVYDDINVLKFGGKFRFSSPRTTIDLKGNYYVYNAKNLEQLPHLPDFDVSLETSVNVTSRINATAGVNITGARKGYVWNNFSDSYTLPLVNTIFDEYDLKTAIDINLSAEYKYSKNMYFFINAENILNQNYQILNAYNNHGLLILLGARVSF